MRLLYDLKNIIFGILVEVFYITLILLSAYIIGYIFIRFIR